MSNRRRRTLTPQMVADVKMAAACPDCDSRVTVNRAGRSRVDVYHDDTCPALAALRRQGRTSQTAIVRRPEQTVEEFAEEASAVAEQVARLFGTVRIAVHPYTDLSMGDAS